jgi:2OG-Fe(II) oxygenase superfamily
MKDLANTSCLQDILDPGKGFLLIRDFMDHDQVNRYRQECAEFLESGQRLCKWPGYGRDRINRDDMQDYVYPSVDASNWRLFQFLHNPHKPATQALYEQALALRDGIEAHWLHDSAYRRLRASMGEYIHVIHYTEGRGIGRHSDFRGTSPFPLLQCVVLLSEPGEDYLGGELFLYTANNRRIGVHTDLDMGMGDIIIFDKSMEHEVEPTRRGATTGVGRWSVIIGGRYHRPALLRRWIRKLTNRLHG